MARRWIHVEQILGVLVHDSEGRAVGRIEEVHAEERNGEALITEFILGEQGLMQRLSISEASMFFLRWFGARRSGSRTSHCVRWEMMDWSIPGKPRLRCRRESLGDAGC